MKFLVVMCVMVAGVSAQYGASGIVKPDGRVRQLSMEEANNIAVIGPSGVVMKDGSHMPFGYDFAVNHNRLPMQQAPALGPYGYSGIVRPDGNNEQFTGAEAFNIVLIGPSGAVTIDGKNVQLDSDGLPVRAKREVLLEGPSGLLFKDGQKRTLPPGVHVVLMTPSGAVLSNGDNVQFRKKRAAPQAVVGPSGLITPSGKLIQLAPGVSVVSAGPSAALLSTGEGIQYSRRRRAATSKAITGESGIITPGLRQVQLPHGVHVVLYGPSAALLSNGEAVQYEF